MLSYISILICSVLAFNFFFFFFQAEDGIRDLTVTGVQTCALPIWKVVVIHNWADCVQIVPGPKENAVSLTHGWADSFVVMHSGNIGLSQDLDTLLDVAYLLRSYRDIVIAIVGDGVKRTTLETRARAEQLPNVP